MGHGVFKKLVDDVITMLVMALVIAKFIVALAVLGLLWSLLPVYLQRSMELKYAVPIWLVVVLVGTPLCLNLINWLPRRQPLVVDTPVNKPNKESPIGEDDSPFSWLGLSLSIKMLNHGILVLGSIGSGKTVLLKNLLHNVWRYSKQQTPKDAKIARVVVFTPKNDLTTRKITDTQLYLGMDARTVNYDAAQDLRDVATKRQFGTHVKISLGDKNSEFWDKWVTEILSAVLTKLEFLAGKKYTLRQVIALISNTALLKAFLAHFPDTESLVSTGLEGEQGQGVLASLTATLTTMSPVISVMDKAGGMKLSAKKFMEMEDVTLVLSWDESHATSLAALHSLFLEHLIDIILKAPRHEITLICVDEYSSIRRVKGFQRLASRGRQSGALLVVGNQLRETLITQAGGEAECDSTLNNLLNMVTLHQESASTRKWISDRSGKLLYHRNIHMNPTPQVVEKANVTEEDIMKIPMANWEKDEVQGIFTNAWISGHKKFTTTMKIDRLETETPYVEAPAEWQVLQRFTIKDAIELNLPLSDPDIRNAIKP